MKNHIPLFLKKRIVKYLFLIVIIFPSGPNGLNAQNPKAILAKSFKKCQSVKSGYYNMTMYLKPWIMKDTLVYNSESNFQKVPDDSLFQQFFHYWEFKNGEKIGEKIYSGTELIEIDNNELSYTVFIISDWKKDILDNKGLYSFFTPVTSPKSLPYPNGLDVNRSDFVYTYVGKEKINSTWCDHIMVDLGILENRFGTMKREMNFWISRVDKIPLQLTTKYDITRFGDTGVQFQKLILNNYKLSSGVENKIQFGVAQVPQNYKGKVADISKKVQLLPNHSQAPDWTLASLRGGDLRLTDLKGKLVLIDFFFKACHPCKLAMPGLQNLYEKYSSRGLEIVGIDPVDIENPEELTGFLQKMGVSYTVLLDKLRTTTDQYNVMGFPTLYLIDRSGKILFSNVGWTEEEEKALEEIILQNL